MAWLKDIVPKAAKTKQTACRHLGVALRQCSMHMYCEALSGAVSQAYSSWPASMLASVMTLLGRLLMVSFSCSNSAPAFLGAAKG